MLSLRSLAAFLALSLVAAPTSSTAQTASAENALLQAFASTCAAANGERAEAGRRALESGWRELDVASTLGAAATASFSHLYAKVEGTAALYLLTGDLAPPDQPGVSFEACNVVAYPSARDAVVADPRSELASWVGFPQEASISTASEPHYVFALRNGQRVQLNPSAPSEFGEEVSAHGVHAISAIHDPQKSMISYMIRRLPS